MPVFGIYGIPTVFSSEYLVVGVERGHSISSRSFPADLDGFLRQDIESTSATFHLYSAVLRCMFLQPLFCIKNYCAPFVIYYPRLP